MRKSIKYLILIGRARIRERAAPLVDGFEIHHVIPKCCGGTNDPSNLVKLTLQEHFIAHRELAAANPEIEGLQIAWEKMSCFRRFGTVEVSPEEFAEARKAGAEARSKIFKGRKMPWVGEANKKRVWSEESLKKIGDSQRGVPKSKEANLKNSMSQPNRKPVRCIDDGRIFVSLSKCDKFYGFVPGTTAGIINNEYKNPKTTLKFEFIKEENDA